MKFWMQVTVVAGQYLAATKPVIVEKDIAPETLGSVFDIQCAVLRIAVTEMCVDMP